MGSLAGESLKETDRFSQTRPVSSFAFCQRQLELFLGSGELSPCLAEEDAALLFLFFQTYALSSLTLLVSVVPGLR